jgi:HSP20 family protein
MTVLTTRNRAPISYNPIGEFDTLRNRLDRFFENPFTEPFLAPAMAWAPPVEITETNGELMLAAELPGMKKEQVTISIENQVLTLSGEKMEERKEGDAEKKYHLWERSYGNFTRSFTLPRAIDTAKVTAEFDNGVLKIHLPKTAEAKAKKIEILAK